MEAEIRRKIEETVIDILKKSNMEEVTEFKVRVTAAERLGIELGGIEQKRFVRSVVESFLLSTETAAATETESNVRAEARERVEEERATEQLGEPNGVPDRVICELSKRKRVMVHDVKGQTYVSIREYLEKDGKQIPTSRGISLTTEQWGVFKMCFAATQKAVIKMETKLRSSKPVIQNEASPTPASAFTPELVPFDTTRFDGKNYHYWAQRMELLFIKLKIAYVLTEPCPSPSPGTKELAQTKAAAQKWRNDDCICIHYILSSLSDHLFYQYSKTTKSAKELWGELKLVYLYEEYGTKRSQVKKYLEFQMVDGRPILDQVQELNIIADSIIAGGMPIDENFHVCTIISKLPLSWKDFYNTLLREKNLPFFALMDHLKAEEESRNQNKQRERSNHVHFHNANKPGPRLGDMNKRNMSWKREPDADDKSVVCYKCGSKGHKSRSCQSENERRVAREERRG